MIYRADAQLGVYYNDLDPFACASIRRNIERGRLGAGLVDPRSIVEVQPADLAGFAICHFFAGIGGFELARLMAGWPDDRELWTGGFPCQDISCAGKGEGITGERSGLWFEFVRLIRACRPARLLIENVPALRTRGADEVLDGLEGAGYAARPIVVGAHAVGAPHRRQRVWIICELADGDGNRFNGTLRDSGAMAGAMRQTEGAESEPARVAHPTSIGSSLADADDRGQQQPQGSLGGQRRRTGDGSASGLADSECDGRGQHQPARESQRGTVVGRSSQTDFPGWPARPGEPQHEWEEPRLVYAKCAGRARPHEARGEAIERESVAGPSGREPGQRQPQPAMGAATPGLPRRLARWRRDSLKAVGNAIVPQVAAEIMAAWMANLQANHRGTESTDGARREDVSA